MDRLLRHQRRFQHTRHDRGIDHSRAGTDFQPVKLGNIIGRRRRYPRLAAQFQDAVLVSRVIHAECLCRDNAPGAFFPKLLHSRRGGLLTVLGRSIHIDIIAAELFTGRKLNGRYACVSLALQPLQAAAERHNADIHNVAFQQGVC